jgi:hypothetical protein
MRIWDMVAFACQILQPPRGGPNSCSQLEHYSAYCDCATLPVEERNDMPAKSGLNC